MNRRLLSPDLLDMISPFTGGIAGSWVPHRGFSSDVLAFIDGSHGRFFIKGVRNRAGGRRDSIVRERLINEAVQPLSPRLLWHVESDQWIVLGFEQVDGEPSVFTAGSKDGPAIVDLMNRIASTPLPEVAQDWPETRWNRFAADAEEAKLFAGDSLVHGDINPSNLLLGEDGSWVVDWAWPTRGSAFIDPALLVLQLISAGQLPEDAEAWVSRCDAWTEADPWGIDAFAMANLRLYRKRAKRFPEQAWLRAMEASAQEWVDHRRGDRDG
ncbi:protein kinase [Streptomyces sp. NPDC020607]|uniref:protein kinase n=1 Tax=Streptomyces sp. NPDC020607 TaxID=3365082 RepID=UPI0037B80CA4